MHVAGPINTPDEARMLEQAAYLTDLRTRLRTRPRAGAAATAHAEPPSLFTY